MKRAAFDGRLDSVIEVCAGIRGKVRFDVNVHAAHPSRKALWPSGRDCPARAFSYIFISFFSAKKSKIGENFLRPDGQNSQIVASTCGFVGRKWP
jgi:hypothetical protein